MIALRKPERPHLFGDLKKRMDLLIPYNKLRPCPTGSYGSFGVVWVCVYRFLTLHTTFIHIDYELHKEYVKV